MPEPVAPPHSEEITAPSSWNRTAASREVCSTANAARALRACVRLRSARVALRRVIAWPTTPERRVKRPRAVGQGPALPALQTIKTVAIPFAPCLREHAARAPRVQSSRLQIAGTPAASIAATTPIAFPIFAPVRAAFPISAVPILTRRYAVFSVVLIAGTEPRATLWIRLTNVAGRVVRWCGT